MSILPCSYIFRNKTKINFPKRVHSTESIYAIQFNTHRTWKRGKFTIVNVVADGNKKIKWTNAKMWNEPNQYPILNINQNQFISAFFSVCFRYSPLCSVWFVLAVCYTCAFCPFRDWIRHNHLDGAESWTKERKHEQKICDKCGRK